MNFEKRYDVIVAGAGIAGVAAALECSRSGLKTVLVEKTIFTGGLATAGLVNIYLPLCDGKGTQVTYGIAEELLHASIWYGPGEVPVEWKEAYAKEEPSRYRAFFAPASFVLALDELLSQARVELWLDTLVSQPIMEGDRVTGVEVENKSGRGALRAGCVIDATGDADIAYRSGAACVEGGNRLGIWAQELSAEAQNPVNAVWLDGSPEPVWHGTRGKEVTAFVLEGRKMLLEHYKRQYAEKGPEWRGKLFPTALPAMAQFRTTRRIIGQTVMEDNQYGRRVEDSVGLVGDWRKAGYVWEIPYRSLVPEKIRGLLAAGRCISSGGDAWQVTRVIPAAALTGQAAGIAATLSIRRNTTADRVDARMIQQKLDENGIPYHIENFGV